MSEFLVFHKETGIMIEPELMVEAYGINIENKIHSPHYVLKSTGELFIEWWNFWTECSQELDKKHYTIKLKDTIGVEF